MNMLHSHFAAGRLHPALNKRCTPSFTPLPPPARKPLAPVGLPQLVGGASSSLPSIKQMSPLHRRAADAESQQQRSTIAKASSADAAGGASGDASAEPQLGKVMVAVLVSVCGAFAFGECEKPQSALLRREASCLA